MKIENTPSKRNPSYNGVVILATELGTQYEKRNGRETYRYDGADNYLKSHINSEIVSKKFIIFFKFGIGERIKNICEICERFKKSNMNSKSLAPNCAWLVS